MAAGRKAGPIAGIPANREQLGFQEEPVFLESAEHMHISRFYKDLWTITLLPIGRTAGTLWPKNARAAFLMPLSDVAGTQDQ